MGGEKESRERSGILFHTYITKKTQKQRKNEEVPRDTYPTSGKNQQADPGIRAFRGRCTGRESIRCPHNGDLVHYEVPTKQASSWWTSSVLEI